MTGMKDHNFPAFEAAAKRLRDNGHFVINPAELSKPFGKPETIAASFKAYYAGAAQSAPDGWSVIAQSVMDADLAAIRTCDAIYLLRGWERSRGAKKELAEAIACELTIMLDEALSLETDGETGGGSHRSRNGEPEAGAQA